MTRLWFVYKKNKNTLPTFPFSILGIFSLKKVDKFIIHFLLWSNKQSKSYSFIHKCGQQEKLVKLTRRIAFIVIIVHFFHCLLRCCDSTLAKMSYSQNY